MTILVNAGGKSVIITVLALVLASASARALCLTPSAGLANILVLHLVLDLREHREAFLLQGLSA